MALVLKEIKASKLNEAAMWYELQAAIEKVADDIQDDFEKTTETWEHPVKFEKITDVSGNLSALVGTDDEIYGYVDKGTRAHRIYPKRPGGRLAFAWAGPGSYSAKTTPNVIGSQGGGASGDMVAFPYVNHPGTKARNFDKIIMKKWQPRFTRRMQDAMKRAAEKSGHKI
jgi:hypothetical protein